MFFRISYFIKSFLVVAFSLMITSMFCVNVLGDNFQKQYVDAMKSYDAGDYLKAFRVIDNAVENYKDVPNYFYIKAIFYLKEAYWANKVNFQFFTNNLYRYYEIVSKRGVQDEGVWNSFVEISSEVLLKDMLKDSLINLLSINPTNSYGLFTLVKLLFSEKKYEYVVKVGERNINNIDTPELFYFLMLSKIYIQDYNNFDDIINATLYNYDSEEIRYIVASVYYQTMDFEKAWAIITYRSNVIDPDIQLKLMIARKSEVKSILSFIKNYQDRLDKDIVRLSELYVKKDLPELEKFLKVKLLSGGFDSIEPIFLHLGLSFPKGSDVYNIALEKVAFNFFSKKMFSNVVNLLEKEKKISKNLKYILAISYIELKKYSKALGLLYDVKGSFSDACVKIPYIYLEMGDYKKARENANSCMKKIMSSGSDIDKYVLSQVFLELGDTSSCQKIMNSIKETNSYYYKMALSTLFFLKKNYKDAEEILYELFEEDKYNPDVINAIAYLWAEKGYKLDEAIKLSKFSLVFENNPYYLDTLAYIYYKMGEFNLAKETIESCIAIIENQSKFIKDVYLHAYMIYKVLGNEEKSKLMLSKANRLGL